ncbi:hypothetical protein BC829DRAFT_395826 [Chytridium lagenaria]|nr:hypothetical protein BC829DRAFT_395826 [Chytridium lagenaria]
MDQDAKNFIEYATSTTPRALEFLEWAKASKLCKVVTADVPEGVFPKYVVNPKLHDIKVDPYGVTKKKGPRGSDDAVYRSSEEIRRRVARGNTILTFTYNMNPLACVPIWALKKFTGGIGDEDDFEETDQGAPTPLSDPTPIWHRFFTTDPNLTSRVVSTQKANGAAGHLAVLKVGKGMYVWIGGSKNVHLAVKGIEDLGRYAEGRYTVAVKVVEAAIMGMREVGVDLDGFLGMLWEKHLTACFELLDPEDAHIEDLSHLTKPELHLYSLVSFEKGVENPNYICEHPERTFETIKKFGLILLPELRKDFVDGVRGDHGNEGRVIYFLDKEGEVIGLLKKKTVWYIVIRAIREKLKVYYAVDFTAIDPSQPLPRMAELALWLGWSKTTLDAWTKVAVAAGDWAAGQIGWEGEKSATEREGFFALMKGRFPVMWAKFLKECGVDDRVALTEDGEGEVVVEEKPQKVPVEAF